MINIHPKLYHDWSAHLDKWDHCTQCPLGPLANKHVLGRGELPAEVLFLGEGPGRDEDRKGYAFVGAAGRLLDAALLAVMERVSFSYFITNTTACRPCDGPRDPNRPPLPSEQHMCKDRVFEIIKLCRPKLIIALGAIAREWLGTNNTTMGYDTVDVYHPAYIVRSGGKASRRFQPYVDEISEAIKQHVGTGPTANL